MAWSGIAQIAKQVLDFAVGVVVARLLSPSDFGVVSACMVFLSFVSIFTSFGFSTAIIQRSCLEEGYVRTAQTLAFGLGIFSTSLMTVCAHLIGGFYNNSSVEEVIPVMSLIFVISSFDMIPTALLTRNLKFSRISVISVVGSVVYGAVTVGMALSGAGVWCIITGQLVSMTVGTLLLFFAASYVPRFALDRSSMRELLSFGGSVTASSLLNHVARNADNMIIGRYLGAEWLGLYTRAYNLSTLPKEVLVSTIGSVLFPTFSRLQGELPRIADAFYKSINAIALVSLPISAAFLVTAPELIECVYGAKWSGARASLQILSLAGFVYTLYIPSTSLLLALGRTRSYAVLQALYSGAIVVSVLSVCGRNIETVAAVVAAVIVISFAAYLRAVHTVIPFCAGSYWSSMRVAVKGTIAMLLALALVKLLFHGTGTTGGVWLFATEAVTGCCAYGLYLNLSKDEVVEELRLLISSKLGGAKA